MRKLLFIAAFLPILGALGWWYFREQSLADYSPAFREYAYVTNGKSNTVSVIDLRTFSLSKTLRVGSEPTGVAASTRKNEIYAVNSGSSSVSVIDAETNTIVATVGVQARPYFIDVSADGKRAYVANSGSSTVSVLDLEKRSAIANIRVGATPGLARVSSDGSTVVVSNRGDNSVSIIDESCCVCVPRYLSASSPKTSPSCPTRAKRSFLAQDRTRSHRSNSKPHIRMTTSSH